MLIYRTQQLTPLIIPMPGQKGPPMSSFNEPPEAAVSRPLSIIALFCWCQLWFAIPAMVYAWKRNKPRKNYNKAIALATTAIVLGMFLTVFLLFYFVHLKSLDDSRRYYG